MLKTQLSVASSKAVTVSEKIESQTDIVRKHYFRINRKKADYELFSQRLLLLLRSQKLGGNYPINSIALPENRRNCGQFPVIREYAGSWTTMKDN